MVNVFILAFSFFAAEHYVGDGKATDRYTIEQDYYWMMGDNRDNSADSRYFGPVRWESLRGTPLFRYWPLNRMGLVR
jgi:signal peptidase I